MKSNNTQYKNKYKNIYSSKNNDNDAYHSGYETTVTEFSFSLLTINLSLSELLRLQVTQTTVPFPRSFFFESLLLQ